MSIMDFKATFFFQSIFCFDDSFLKSTGLTRSSFRYILEVESVYIQRFDD